MVVVRYVRDTSDYAITYGATVRPSFRDFLVKHSRKLDEDVRDLLDVCFMSDSSHGGPRPMSCSIGFVKGVPYVWKMGKLTWTTLNVCEGEWFAQTNGVMILQAHAHIYVFLGIEHTLPVLSFCDNQSAISISEAGGTTKRLKHVLTRMAYLQEKVDEKLVVLLHIDTNGMIADIGTKMLSATEFHRLRDLLVRTP